MAADRRQGDLCGVPSDGYRVRCDPRAVTVCHITAAPGRASQVSGGYCPGRTGSLCGERYSVIRLQNPSSSPWIPGLPKFEHHDDRHEPTLIAAARSQMTANSPRRTFSRAELAGELVTRRIQGRRVRIGAVRHRCRGRRPSAGPGRPAPSLSARCSNLGDKCSTRSTQANW